MSRFAAILRGLILLSVNDSTQFRNNVINRIDQKNRNEAIHSYWTAAGRHISSACDKFAQQNNISVRHG